MTCGFQPSHTRGVNMFLFNLIVFLLALILGIAILEKVRIAFVFLGLSLSLACHSSGIEWLSLAATFWFLGFGLGLMLSDSPVFERTFNASAAASVKDQLSEPVYNYGPLMELILEQTRPAEDRPFHSWNDRLGALMHENYPDLVAEVPWSTNPSYVCFCMVETVDRHCGYDGLTRLEEALRKA